MSLSDVLESWFGASPALAVSATPAALLMRQLNPKALVSSENGCVVCVEDHWDSPQDRRMYRLEYRSTPDGRHAVAYCVSNPWNRQDCSAGVSVSVGHVFSNGALCLGSNHTQSVADSPYELRTVVARARYWCTGFSVLQESGTFPNL